MNLDVEVRRTARKLKAMVRQAQQMRAAGAMLDKAHCDELRALAAAIEQIVILRGGASGAGALIAEATALIESCAPLASLRAIKLDYIERLAAACDALMCAGQMPAADYLNALGSAVSDFECDHSCGEDVSALAFAWDILAQAEAGLGQATNDGHYERAEQRYRRTRRTPALTLVSTI